MRLVEHFIFFPNEFNKSNYTGAHALDFFLSYEVKSTVKLRFGRAKIYLL